MKFSETPLAKGLAFLCIPAMLFILANIILAQFDIFGKPWIRELDILFRNGLPFFLFLTGSFIRNENLRIPLLVFLPVLIISYFVKMLDFYGMMDVNVKWVLCPALFGLLLTYSVHFFSKQQKNLLDYLKMLWLLAISYVMLSIYFPIGIKLMYVFEGTTYLMLVLMSYGLAEYFRKGNEENNFL